MDAIRDDFYKNVKGFGQFSQLSDPSHYVAAPASWCVVVTDVINSTLAIENGQYKDINLSGAAVIMSILNLAREVALPYAFGGDGATMLIPASLRDEALQALAAVQTKVELAFNLELRTGLVPVQALYDAGCTLLVGKFHLSSTASQAVFQGNALAMAEQWLKKNSDNVIRPQTSTGEPDLEGLECRWQPLHNRHGKIISLLVKVAPAYEKQAWKIYAETLKAIEAIYPEHSQSSPATTGGMQLSFSPATLMREVKLRSRDSLPAKAFYCIRMLLTNLIGKCSFLSKRKLLGFDGAQYLQELVANSDSRKFDEMLRMVLDSTQSQHDELVHTLETKRASGQILYGLHESSQALMTCLVFSTSGDHVHLVDGADGGYALAAKQLKQQLKAAG